MRFLAASAFSCDRWGGEDEEPKVVGLDPCDRSDDYTWETKHLRMDSQEDRLVLEMGGRLELTNTRLGSYDVLDFQRFSFRRELSPLGTPLRHVANGTVVANGTTFSYVEDEL